MSSRRGTPRNRVHVISRDRGWAVKREGRSKASRILPNKEAAVRRARTLRGQGQDIIVHRRDGSIQRWERAER